MKIPKKLKVGGHIIKVKMMENDSGKYGAFDSSKGEIYICGSVPQTQQEETLIHEIFHVMNSTFSDTKEGHTLLDSLSAQFYQVLHDNKLLR